VLCGSAILKCGPESRNENADFAKMLRLYTSRFAIPAQKVIWRDEMRTFEV
jgi:hypothetical protein